MKKWFELCFFASRGWIFENHTLKALNIPFKKVVLPARVKCGGKEGKIVVAHGCRKTKKANMWHGRGNSGGSWPPAFPCSLGASKARHLPHTPPTILLPSTSLLDITSLLHSLLKLPPRYYLPPPFSPQPLS